MRGQVAGRDGPRASRLLERRRDASVQADAPAGRQVADDGLPHERVRECEAVEGAGRPDELRLLGRFERIEGALGIDAARRRDDVGVELVPRHGCDLQQLDDAGREAGEPPAHDVADARGDGSLRGVALSERANHLPDEERVPLRHLSDPWGERGRPPGVAEDVGDIALGQRSELQPAHVRPARQPRHHRRQQWRAARFRVAVGRDHEQAHARVGAEDVLNEQERQVLGPVEVVEHEQHGLRLAGRLQQ